MYSGISSPSTAIWWHRSQTSANILTVYVIFLIFPPTSASWRTNAPLLQTKHFMVLSRSSSPGESSTSKNDYPLDNTSDTLPVAYLQSTSRSRKTGKQAARLFAAVLELLKIAVRTNVRRHTSKMVDPAPAVTIFRPFSLTKLSLYYARFSKRALQRTPRRRIEEIAKCALYRAGSSTFNFARVPLMRISLAPFAIRIVRRPSSCVAPRPV